MEDQKLSRDKINELQKSQKVEIFEDILKNKIQSTMLLDELSDPKILKPIGRQGEALDEPLRDDKINVQMYWQGENKLIGTLIGVPAFIFLILLIGLNNNIFDGVVSSIAWTINIILGFIPVI